MIKNDILKEFLSDLEGNHVVCKKKKKKNTEN